MKVSVITPVLNEPRIGRTLYSILSQSHSELELIIIDGGSTDGTLDILESYRDRLDIFISEPDDGIYHAMNKGIEHSTGDIVAILNANDYYTDPNVLRDVVDKFEDDTIDIVYADIIFVRDGKDVSYWDMGKKASWTQGALFPGRVPPHPTSFIRRSAYDKYGLYRSNFPVAADSELLYRFIFKLNLKTSYIDRVLVRFNMDGTSSAHTKVRYNFYPPLEIIRIWKTNHEYKWLVYLATWPVYKLVAMPTYRLLKRLRNA